MPACRIFPHTSSLVLSLCAALLTASSARAEPEEDQVPVYSVKVYDPKRKPSEDLKETVRLAEAGKKRILLQVGGAWCGWCRAMNTFFQEHEKVARTLAENYLIMKVNWSPENPNGFFLKDYPDIESFPHLFVLESDGAFLHSQPTEGFEQRGSYSEKKLLEFLEKWKG